MINYFTINLDRLELMLAKRTRRTDFFGPNFDLDLYEITPATAADSYEWKGFILHRAEARGNYLVSYDVYTPTGCELGTIQMVSMKPTTFFNGKPLIHFKLDKRLLYTDNLLDYTNAFLSAFTLKINNIRYYEIALDTNTNANKLFTDKFHSERLWFMSKERTIEKILKVSTLYRTGAEESSFYVGEKGNVQVCFYSKTKKHGYESFIKQFHADNGLDILLEIFRIEVRVSRRAFKSYRNVYRCGEKQLTESQYSKLGDKEKSVFTKRVVHKSREITLGDLTDKNKLLSLFKLDFTAQIDFRMKNRKQKARCQKLQLIDFKQVPTYTYTVNEKESMSMNKNNEKESIKDLLRLYKVVGKPLFLDEAKELAQEHGLGDYFHEQLAKLKPRAGTPTPHH
jgi:hypothetical protein